MRSIRRDKNHISRLKRILLRAILKNAAPADDDVNLIFRMRLLRVVADGLVNFD